MKISKIDKVESASAVIAEICDDSDLRFYQGVGELHAILPEDWTKILIEKLTSMGWKLKWRKDGIRKYENGERWDRLAFILT